MIERIASAAVLLFLLAMVGSYIFFYFTANYFPMLWVFGTLGAIVIGSAILGLLFLTVVVVWREIVFVFTGER